MEHSKGADQIQGLLVMGRKTRSLLVDQLESLGITVLTVSSCRQVRRAFQSHPEIRVVLTDAALPDSDWRCVLGVAARDCPSAEVVICTRQADVTLWCDALEAGAYDLLVEPYYEPEVERIVRAAVGQSASQPGGWLGPKGTTAQREDCDVSC